MVSRHPALIIGAMVAGSTPNIDSISKDGLIFIESLCPALEHRWPWPPSPNMFCTLFYGGTGRQILVEHHPGIEVFQNPGVTSGRIVGGVNSLGVLFPPINP